MAIDVRFLRAARTTGAALVVVALAGCGSSNSGAKAPSYATVTCDTCGSDSACLARCNPAPHEQNDPPPADAMPLKHR